MDALEFLMERKRMCNSYEDCCDCPFAASHCIINHVTSDDDCEKMIAIVERWSKEHPRKTIQSVFLEQFPDAIISYDGLPDVAPVRHGQWEPGNPICPVCGEDKFKDLDADIWCDWKPDYCPNCGAKMDGGADHADD